MGCKFSILMANYNAQKFVKHAIKSVLAQKYQDWELIIVDDKSTDNSVDKIKNFDDDRIKFFQRDKNGGYGETLRTTMKYATGEICGVLDSDDALREDALSIMAKAHDKYPKHGLIYSQYVKCNESMKRTARGDCGPLPKGITWLDIMLKKIPAPRPRVSHFKTFKRSAYDKTSGFHELRRTVDKDIVLKLEEITKLLYVDEELYFYRAHPAGISRSTKTHPYGKQVIERAKKRRGL